MYTVINKYTLDLILENNYSKNSYSVIYFIKLKIIF